MQKLRCPTCGSVWLDGRTLNPRTLDSPNLVYTARPRSHCWVSSGAHFSAQREHLLWDTLVSEDHVLYRLSGGGSSAGRSVPSRSADVHIKSLNDLDHGAPH